MKKALTKKQSIKLGIIWGIVSCILATFIIGPLIGAQIPDSITKTIVIFLIWSICGVGYGLTMYATQRKDKSK